MNGARKEVADAEKAEQITDDWSSLLQQYKTLSEAQSADMKRLNEDKDRLLQDARDKEKELQKRGCLQEEYEELVYSEELETKAIQEQSAAEARYRASAEAAEQARMIKARAEVDCDHASKDLSEYGGDALPQNEVGSSFDERIEVLSGSIAEIDRNLKVHESEKSALHRTKGRAENMTETHTRPVSYAVMELEADHQSRLLL